MPCCTALVRHLRLGASLVTGAMQSSVALHPSPPRLAGCTQVALLGHLAHHCASPNPCQSTVPTPAAITPECPVLRAPAMQIAAWPAYTCSSAGLLPPHAPRLRRAPLSPARPRPSTGRGTPHSETGGKRGGPGRSPRAPPQTFTPTRLAGAISSRLPGLPGTAPLTTRAPFSVSTFSTCVSKGGCA